MTGKYFFTLLLTVFLIVFFYVKIVYIPKITLKVAVKKKELSGKEYILCRTVKVTGFDWICIKNENGNDTEEYCNIIGPNPFDTFKLSHEFEMARNTFVFYVAEERRYYSEEMREEMLDYVVTGWDVLYPVIHGDISILSLFFTRKYMTKADLWNGVPYLPSPALNSPELGKGAKWKTFKPEKETTENSTSKQSSQND